MSVRIHYLNQSFGRRWGAELYGYVANCGRRKRTTWAGDWLFRQAAFPAQADNAEQYFRRYFPRGGDARTARLRESLLAQRAGIDALLESLIDEHQLDRAGIAGFTSMFALEPWHLRDGAKAEGKESRASSRSWAARTATRRWANRSPVHVPHVDFVFSGPALRTFPAFVRHCLNQEMAPCSAMRGVFSKDNCQAADSTVRGTIGEEEDMDADIRPDYGSFLDALEAYFPNERLKPCLLFKTSRGGWWGERCHCTFCGLNGDSMAFHAMRPDMRRRGTARSLSPLPAVHPVPVRGQCHAAELPPRRLSGSGDARGCHDFLRGQSEYDRRRHGTAGEGQDHPRSAGHRVPRHQHAQADEEGDDRLPEHPVSPELRRARD